MKCVDCGKKIVVIPNRHPICECGSTNITSDECQFYIELHFDRKEFVKLNNFDNVTIYELSTVETILDVIFKYPIRNSEKEKNKLLTKLRDSNNYNEVEIEKLEIMPTKYLLSHYLMYKISPSYRKVFHELDKRIVDEIIESNYNLSYIDKDKENRYLSIDEIINKYKEYEKKLYALPNRLPLFESIAMGVEPELSVRLVNLNIHIEEYINYKKENVILKDDYSLLLLIEEFGKLGYRGFAIFEKIDEYIELTSKAGLFFPEIELEEENLESVMTKCRILITEAEKKNPLSKVLTDRLYMEIDGTDVREVESENYTISEINPYEYFSVYSEHPGLWTALGLIVKKPLKIVDKNTDKVVSFVIYDGMTITINGLTNSEIIKLINKYHDETEE